MTITRAVSIKLDYPTRSLYEVINNTENFLKLLPVKIKINKIEKESLQFKLSGFGFEGPVTGSLEGKELGEEQYLVTFSAIGETSVGVGVIRYKTRVDFTIKIELIPLDSQTDLRIEFTYNSPYENEMLKNVIEFLNALAEKISKDIPSMVQKMPSLTKVIEKPKVQLPATSQPSTQISHETEVKAIEPKQEVSVTLVEKDLSNKLGDPIFLNEILRDAKVIGSEFGIFGEEMIGKITEMSRSSTFPIFLNCRVSGDRLRIIFSKGKIVAIWGEVGGRILIGESVLRSFYGKEVLCPLYEVKISGI